MSGPDFPTPQDAEDALYDALEANDLQAFMGAWDSNEDIACLIPMQAFRIGHKQVTELWKPLMSGKHKLDIQVKHIHWIESDNLAIHLVEEKITLEGQSQPQAPVYATNVFRKTGNGWRVIMHQNSPVPPPPGFKPPGM